MQAYAVLSVMEGESKTKNLAMRARAASAMICLGYVLLLAITMLTVVAPQTDHAREAQNILCGGNLDFAAQFDAAGNMLTLKTENGESHINSPHWKTKHDQVMSFINLQMP